MALGRKPTRYSSPCYPSAAHSRRSGSSQATTRASAPRFPPPHAQGAQGAHRLNALLSTAFPSAVRTGGTRAATHCTTLLYPQYISRAELSFKRVPAAPRFRHRNACFQKHCFHHSISNALSARTFSSLELGTVSIMMRTKANATQGGVTRTN